MISSSAIIWDVLACGSVEGDVFWCNRLSFLDLGAISRHIACVSLGRRRKNMYSHGAGVFFFMVPLAIPASTALSQ